MKLTELEHDGNEDFSSFPDRKKIKKTVLRRELTKPEDEARKHTLKEELQRLWLSPMNPLIWDGDRD